MQKTQEYLTVVGLFALVAVASLLMSTPEDLFSSTVVIDVSKTQKTAYEMLVTTIFDFKNAQELEGLPTEMGGMNSRSVNITANEARMGALLKRMYSDENRSVLFMLLSSKNMTEFHNLEECYGGSWNITEKDVMEIKSEKLGEVGFNSIHVNRFIIQRGNLEQVVLHWYQWDGGLIRTDKNFMLIQVGTPVETTKEEAIATAEKFTKEFFAKMYKPVQRTKPIGEDLIGKYGIVGMALDLILILIPLVMIFNPKITSILKKK